MTNSEKIKSMNEENKSMNEEKIKSMNEEKVESSSELHICPEDFDRCLMFSDCNECMRTWMIGWK